MELYLHVPFCVRKCRYCDFASYAGRMDDRSRYVDALIREAEMYAPMMQHECTETAFIGGGTPSVLSPEDMKRMLLAMKRLFQFADDIEWTTEANPGTITRAWLDAAVQGGVNRLSLGMQAYQPQLLETLGRIHRFEDVAEAVTMARSAGIDNISLDLMFGLPGQTREHWLETLQAALSLKPDHLSCYGLIPEEGTPLVRDLDSGRLSLPEEETERLMYDDTLSVLAEHGFEQYEISNFAMPGKACRHNIGYWRQVPYLGLGASASSMLMDDSGSCKYRRIANPAGLDDYLRMVYEGRADLRSVEEVSPADAQFETLMVGLRMTEGVSEAAYESYHGEPLSRRYGSVLSHLKGEGLLEHKYGRWFLTRRGMDVQNAVLVELMET